MSDAIQATGAELSPGMSTADIASAVHRRIRGAGLESSMLGFHGFPAVACVSLEDEVVHGIPGERRVSEGDLVKLQINVAAGSAFAAQGWTFVVGTPTEERARLLATGIAALKDAVAACRGGMRTGDLGARIQATAEARGCSAVRDYTGYVISTEPMRGPQLPCFGRAGTGSVLPAGAILHVHAIVNAGGYATCVGDDEWTVKTLDGSPSVLFTAMVLLESDGHLLLTPILDASCY